MTPRPKQMDPDRYQMRDIKRRLSAQEKYYARLDARILRLRAQTVRQIDLIRQEFRGSYTSDE